MELNEKLALHAEVSMHRAMLRQYYRGEPQGAAGHALNEVFVGRSTEANLDILRTLVKLLRGVGEDGTVIAEAVNIVRSQLRRDAAPLLTKAHLNAFAEIRVAWRDANPTINEHLRNKRNASIAYVFEDLSMTPFVVAAIERGVVEPEEVKELAHGLMSINSAVSEGAL